MLPTRSTIPFIDNPQTSHTISISNEQSDYPTIIMKQTSILAALLILLLTTACHHTAKTSSADAGGDTLVTNPLTLADPTIFHCEADGMYYLYGTSPHSNFGFQVYRSEDLRHWEGPCGALDGGYALSRNTSVGEGGFWAPQVIAVNGQYAMIYTSDERLGIAFSDSPRGPFTQEVKQHMPADMKQIDPFVFFDNDGKAYLYHVRLGGGNHIWVAELNDDLQSVREETAVHCLTSEPGWEDTGFVDVPITEGPTVIRVGDTYLMFYSCNDFRSPDYAVGCATAPSPFGPWTKPAAPLIHRSVLGVNGTGHGDLFQDGTGKWRYVFHTHQSDSVVAPRRTAIVDVNFEGTTPSIDASTFRFLQRP
ncbi:MAG: glycoside hydrolase family 43 protein [Bacteroidaceae bacterium]|nr:glycoside hydrolase family 43 protein [Bacteroidaceae bacterium]